MNSRDAMLRYLIDLERPFDPTVNRSYDPGTLVRYALRASDYWAELALSWLEQGVQSAGVVESLREVEATAHWPQSLRHRARAARKAAERQV